MIVYRICNYRKGKLYSLFHGTNHTRYIPLNTWMKAEEKLMRDGSGKSYYISGFHVMPDLDEVRTWFNKAFKFAQDRVIVKCEIKDGSLRKKDHSKYGIFLTSEMKVLEIIEPCKFFGKGE